MAAVAGRNSVGAADGQAAVHGVDERPGSGKVGALVAQPVHAEGAKTAVAVEREFRLHAQGTAMRFSRQLLGAGADPLDRTSELARRPHQQHILHVDAGARAEAAADILRAHPHLRRFEPQDVAQAGAERRRSLVGHVQFKPLGGRVIGRQAGTQFQRTGGHALAVELEPHHMLRSLEGFRGGRFVAVLVVEHQVAGHRFMHQRRARRDRVFRMRHHRQVFVIHRDKPEGVQCCEGGSGHHQRHLFAHIAHPVARDRATWRHDDRPAAASRVGHQSAR